MAIFIGRLLGFLLGYSFAFTLGALLVTYRASTDGYVMSTLWGWFIVPEYAAIPELSFEFCCGLSLLGRLFVKRKGSSSFTFGDYFTLFAAPWVILSAAYVVRHFMGTT